jgi:hypothetical protein
MHMSKINTPYSYDAKTGLVSRDGVPGFYLRVAEDGYLPVRALDVMVDSILLPALDVVGFGGREGLDVLKFAQAAFGEAFEGRKQRTGMVMVTASELKATKDQPDPAIPEAVTMDVLLRELEAMAKNGPGKAN